MKVGIAREDITGPVSHVGMMGYADTLQRASGLLNRQYVRVYAVEDENGELLIFAHCDLHSIPLALHEEVIKRVTEALPGVRSDHVVIHGQHTHSGAAGLDTFFLYYLTNFGFTPIQFEMTVDQITTAIIKAFANRKAARLEMTWEKITHCSKQRSLTAYMANPEGERALYHYPKNTNMTIVKIMDDKTEEMVGLWTFFAVHTTSLQGMSTMISSDNKGYAEWLLEEKYPGTTAAFFQIDAGDVSPNTVDKRDGTFTGEFGDDFVRNSEFVGKCQADAAIRALEREKGWKPLADSIFAKKVNFDFSKYDKLCPAINGAHFLAGTEDGRGLWLMEEGNLRNMGPPIFRRLGRVVTPVIVPDEVEKCHTPKVPCLATGLMDPPGTPPVLPMQVARIGQLGFAVIPFETTTMSGRRIRKTVQKAFQDSGEKVDHVEVVACSNAYSQYLTTFEEYGQQHYEGASTHFGPHQLEAVQDILQRLIADPTVDRDASPVVLPDPMPALTSIATEKLDKPVIPPWTHIAATFSEVPNLKKDKMIGEDVRASFWCGRPMNSQLMVGSFCDAEKRNDLGQWVTFVTDHDWSLRFLWRSKYLVFGTCTCQWIVPPKAQPGTYRLVHRGAYIEGGSTKRYVSHSAPFQVSSEIYPHEFDTSYEYRFGIPNELIVSLLAVFAIIFLVCKKKSNRLHKPTTLRKSKQI